MADLVDVITQIVSEVNAETKAIRAGNGETVAKAMEKVITMAMVEAERNPAMLKQDRFGDSQFQKFVVLVGTQVVMATLTAEMLEAYRRGRTEGAEATDVAGIGKPNVGRGHSGDVGQPEHGEDD